MKSIAGFTFAALASVAMAGGGARCASGPSLQLGAIPIGASPTDFSGFRSNDCEGQEPPLSDCSAEGTDGLRYGFFDGGLTRVVAETGVADPHVRLPGGIKFGQDIDAAAAELERSGLRFDRGRDGEGRVVHSTDFVVTSAAGVNYSLELVADVEGRLAKVIERTDF